VLVQAHSSAAFLSSQLPNAEPIPRDWAVVRHATPSDVRALANIYHEVYRGTYTYHEYLDPDYLKHEIESGLAGWYAVEDGTAPGEIAGCVSAKVDPIHQRAYSRGMMLRPAWQGRGGASHVFCECFQDFKSGRPGIRVLYSETRATSIKPQATCEAIGLHPLGILPNKDVFFGARESPVLMAVYSSAAWATRETSVKIVPELEPLYRFCVTQHLAMRKDTLEIVAHDAGQVGHPAAEIDIQATKQKYGYTRYTFTCQKTGESIELGVNAQCMNAEGLEIHCSRPATARALMMFALEYLRARGVQYMEGYCPATKPGLQSAFLDAGYRPLGYAPAWNLDRRTGRFVDQVVFGWSKRFATGATALTKASEKLAGVLGLSEEK